MSIYEITASTTVAAEPAQVWAVLDDFGGWPRWMPGLEKVRIELLSAGPPRQGYRFRVKGGVVHADMQVTGFGALERATSFKLSFPPLKGDNRCTLHPLEDGRYRLERVDHLYLPGKVIDFLNATQRERFEKLAVAFLAALKQTAERRQQHGSRAAARPA